MLFIANFRFRTLNYGGNEPHRKERKVMLIEADNREDAEWKLHQHMETSFFQMRTEGDPRQLKFNNGRGIEDLELTEPIR